MKVRRPKIDVRVRRACAAEAHLLTALALRSKAYWGYPEEFMTAFKPELVISELYIISSPVFVAVLDEKIVGFMGLSLREASPELVFLFVEPEFIGKGCGEVLWQKCLAEARELGWKSFVIVSDPNSEQFYLKRGAIKTGEKSFAVVPDRKVPVLKYEMLNRG